MDNSVNNYLRSFGMSGYLITEELKGIENRYNIQFNHGLTMKDESSAVYYSQFEQSVRAEAANMSRHYELFYCLEKSIRKLISEALYDAEGADWWESNRIPEQIRAEVRTREQKEIDSGVTRRSDKLIDYTTFGELSVVITSNWDIFDTIFSSKRAVEKVMSSLNLIRGPIAHCCPITEDEVDRLVLTVKDWFRTMA